MNKIYNKQINIINFDHDGSNLHSNLTNAPSEVFQQFNLLLNKYFKNISF